MPHRTAGIYIEATHATTIDLEIHGWVEEETLEPPVKGDQFFLFGCGIFFGGGRKFYRNYWKQKTRKKEVSNQLINVDMLEEHKQWESFWKKLTWNTPLYHVLNLSYGRFWGSLNVKVAQNVLLIAVIFSCNGWIPSGNRKPVDMKLWQVLYQQWMEVEILRFLMLESEDIWHSVECQVERRLLDSYHAECLHPRDPTWKMFAKIGWFIPGRPTKLSSNLSDHKANAINRDGGFCNVCGHHHLQCTHPQDASHRGGWLTAFWR